MDGCYGPHKWTSRSITVGDIGVTGCCAGSVRASQTMGQEVSHMTRSRCKFRTWERGNMGTGHTDVLTYQRTEYFIGVRLCI